MNEPMRPDDMRVSDAERSAVQDRLRRAHDVGQLDLTEFDERAKQVWAARTRGELQRVTNDLPAPPPEPRKEGVFANTGGGTAMRVLTIIWSTLLAVNLVIWGIVALTAGFVYPWWIWVATPGVALGVLYAFGVGRPERGDR